MGRIRGLFDFAASFEVQYAEPLDGRAVVEKFTDLAEYDTWASPDGNAYTYVGMRVSVVNDDQSLNGVYWLADPDYTNLNNWKPMGSGGSGSLLKISFEDKDILTIEDINNDGIIQVYKEVQIVTNILYNAHRFGEVTYSQEVETVYEVIHPRIFYNPLANTIQIIFDEITTGHVLVKF